MSAIRDVPDFPKPGILFKDITPILHDPSLCRDLVDDFVTKLAGTRIDVVAGIESRGFLFGFMLANKLNVPFILIRKAGKLPYKKIACEYDLEYGSAKIEMQEEEISKGAQVLIHDDLLATGGTAEAAAKLIEMQGGTVAAFAFIVELGFLNGAERLKKFGPIIRTVAY
jgi:adenine phosphoribosyltransferase